MVESFCTKVSACGDQTCELALPFSLDTFKTVLLAGWVIVNMAFILVSSARKYLSKKKSADTITDKDKSLSKNVLVTTIIHVSYRHNIASSPPLRTDLGRKSLRQHF